MDLGKFTLSLTVKDIGLSKTFYENLGFKAIDGSYKNKDFQMQDGQDWLILQNGDTVIGLFQGMFGHNLLTFHPTDVRQLQRDLKDMGVGFDVEADESTEGPASAILNDPDGNVILLDQPPAE